MLKNFQVASSEIDINIVITITKYEENAKHVKFVQEEYCQIDSDKSTR